MTDPGALRRACSPSCRRGGAVSGATRFALAAQAFAHTAAYDGAISNYLSALAGPSDGVPSGRVPGAEQRCRFVKLQDLRYGENPHQSAAFYRDLHPGARHRWSTATQLQGKELSYNNIADADAAWECVKSFDADAGACVIVKHANPCGVAVGADAGRGLRQGASRPIRPRPSAASSPSTGRSTARPPSWWPSSSSRC